MASSQQQWPPRSSSPQARWSGRNSHSPMRRRFRRSSKPDCDDSRRRWPPHSSSPAGTSVAPFQSEPQSDNGAVALQRQTVVFAGGDGHHVRQARGHVGLAVTVDCPRRRPCRRSSMPDCDKKPAATATTFDKPAGHVGFPVTVIAPGDDSAVAFQKPDCDKSRRRRPQHASDPRARSFDRHCYRPRRRRCRRSSKPEWAHRRRSATAFVKPGGIGGSDSDSPGERIAVRIDRREIVGGSVPVESRVTIALYVMMGRRIAVHRRHRHDGRIACPGGKASLRQHGRRRTEPALAVQRCDLQSGLGVVGRPAPRPCDQAAAGIADTRIR